jgi:hypothetical protein
MTSTAKWVTFTRVGPLGAQFAVLDADKQVIETHAHPVTHSVGGGPVMFAAVHPWLAEHYLETPGVWQLNGSNEEFIAEVRPLLKPFQPGQPRDV